LKPSGGLEIVDRLIGRGRHEVRWHFHLAPGVAAERVTETSVALAAAGRRWHLRLPSGFDISINHSAYSPSYGVAVPCHAIDAASIVDLDGARTWEFAIAS
jgi:hypothetical protein